MRVYKKFLFWLLALLITACSAKPEYIPDPTPSPAVQVRLDPLVEWLQPAIQTCSRQIPERNWIILPSELSLSETVDTNVQFFWGTETSLSENTFLITNDRLLVVTNPANPIHSLTASEIRSIFSGKISQWDEVAENLPADDIRVWLYPQTLSIMGNFIQWSGLSPQSLTPLAFLAPHPHELRKAIADDPLAIGILSEHWLNDEIVAVEVDGEQNDAVFPVLASVNATDGYIQEWLFCIQNQIRP